ncbi:MAG TPA: nucleotidyltransferase [Solirubrobacterales bacterium]|jgi:predicted nucleotidyltransferase
MSDADHPFAEIEATFRKSVSALTKAGVPFLLGGTLASWARGGPESRNDLDLMVKPADAERALEVLEEVGMRGERPPESWLLKAWDGEVLVDLIFRPKGFEITDAVIERGEVLEVLAMEVRVISLEDLLVSKLLVLDDHQLDLAPPLRIARALREKIDWAEVHSRTAESPYAAAFFTLIERLHLIDGTRAGHHDRADVRVLN